MNSDQFLCRVNYRLSSQKCRGRTDLFTNQVILRVFSLLVISKVFCLAWAGYEFWRSERGIIQPQDVFQVPVIPK